MWKRLEANRTQNVRTVGLIGPVPDQDIARMVGATINVLLSVPVNGGSSVGRVPPF